MTVPLSTVPIGHTALSVTRLGLGTAPFGNLYRPISQEQATQTIHTALERDIRYFDTAPLYGAGQSEQYLGSALAGVPRSSYIISTKVGRLITPGGEVVFNYSRDGILRSLEESLQRLKVDAVDILLVHDPDNHYQQALDEAFPTLVELRSQGVIKAIGAGMNQWEMPKEIAQHIDVNCFLLAGRYTLLEQTSLDEFLPLCEEKKISVIIGGVFNSGILAQGARPGARYNYGIAPQEIMEKVQRIEEICARFQVPLPAAALQFPGAHPAVGPILIGVESPEEVISNLNLWQTTIPADFWATLRAEGLVRTEAPVPQT